LSIRLWMKSCAESQLGFHSLEHKLPERRREFLITIWDNNLGKSM
jgi:hypothetical protein